MIEDAKQRFASLKSGGMLPSPKGVALAVLELTQKNDVSLGTLTHLVQTDPAMAGRILRYANAVHGGSLRHIASLSHAIVFLGLFRVRQIALGFSLIDNYRSGACNGFDYLGYWTASLATGIAAQQVSEQAQCPPDESFTCGLLSGIGRLALATVFPEEYGKLLQQNMEALALREAEAEQFGLDHAALSAELLEDWGLPEIFHQAVRHHEIPAEAPFPAGSRVQVLTSALHFAAKVGNLLTLDSTQRWERVPSLYHAAAQVGLEDHEVPPLVDRVVTQWQDWGRELHLPTRDFSDVKQLLSNPPEPGAEEGLSALVVLPMRVTLAASTAALLRNLAQTLDAMGLSVDLAADQESALRLLAKSESDLLMVELGGDCEAGVRTLRTLRACEGGRQAYCIALIPPAAEANVAKLMLAGASDYLLFGYSEAALMARLTAAQRVVALQGAVRAEREAVIRPTGNVAPTTRPVFTKAHPAPFLRLHNRRYGMDRFQQEWSFSQHSGTSLACLMLDVDYFKRINDVHGHEVGDLVLTQVARVVEKGCRKDDVVFRFGGEEFCVVSPNTSLAETVMLAERIVRAVRDADFGGKGRAFPVTVSVGVAARPNTDTGMDSLVARADKALYAAKEGGRDRVMASRGGGEEAGLQFLQAQARQDLGKPLGGPAARQILVGGNDQLVLHGVFPAHQLGHVDLIAVGFQLQTAQHVGDMAAELPGMQGVTPEFRQGVFQRPALVPAQHSRRFRLAAGHQHDKAGPLRQGKTDGVVRGRIAGVQGGHHRHRRRQRGGSDGVGNRQVEEAHVVESQVPGQVHRALHQLFPGFDPQHSGLGCNCLEEQVIQDEAQVGLAGTVVHQTEIRPLLRRLREQRFDELEQVIDLLELAPAILVHLAVAGEDVQCLEQFDGLAGTDFVHDGNTVGGKSAMLPIPAPPATAVPPFST